MGIGVFAVVAIVAMVLCALLEQFRPEFAILLGISAGVFILLGVWQQLAVVIAVIRDAASRASLENELLVLILKTGGMAFIGSVVAAACRDAGKSALAMQLETAVRILMIAQSLPALNRLFSIVTTLLQ